MRNILVSLDSGQLDYLPYLPFNATQSSLPKGYQQYLRHLGETNQKWYMHDSFKTPKNTLRKTTVDQTSNDKMNMRYEQWVSTQEANLSYRIGSIAI